ncbi:type III-B CRISPR module RAMP protein Cmr6 [Nocardia lijiangensis]|uniref:type III-B CRISPR module RAMP protein Cmr6 n=1 Tax=Nocardia lijiangensis TaxID=299618 RepID=UPI003D761D86
MSPARPGCGDPCVRPRGLLGNASHLLHRTRVDCTPECRLNHYRAVIAAAARFDTAFLTNLHSRRLAAVRGVAGSDVVVQVGIIPRWRVVLGHGATSAAETSLTMSPTYGFPIFPGSALKGVSASYLRGREDESDTQERLRRLFGSPRPTEQRDDATKGTVTWFDALPVGTPRLVIDTLTPHVAPYYRDGHTTGAPRQAPAEYHNPIPVRFLAATAGDKSSGYRALLTGPAEDVRDAATLLCAALDDLGIGGKTSAGYGYCQARWEELTMSERSERIMGQRAARMPEPSVSEAQA